jgi:D-alanyl-D-alanine carboxypeptidase
MPSSRSILITAAVTAATALGAVAAPPVTASPAPAASNHRAAGVATHQSPSPDLQRRLDRLVTDTGFPGAIATVRDRDGRVRTYTAGSGNLEDGSPVRGDGHVRIASNTKMFTATVVLQLVGEGTIDLDAPVARYLPGVVHGHGNDGDHITIRQLLQQTSGLPDYDTIVEKQGGYLQAVAHTYVEPRQLLDAALNERRHFRPGTKWEYSNTNYIILGLVVQRVTGRPIGEEITRRVIRRAGLTHTYWPGLGEQRLRGRHPHGYWADSPGAPYEDITTMDPSLGWAAGQLVSTTADLGRFMAVLLGGDLLRPAQLREMRTTVSAPGFEPEPGWRYGLGIGRHRLSCGGYAWGHGGDIQGFETRNLITPDGRWAVVAVTALPTSVEMLADVDKVVTSAVCGSATPARGGEGGGAVAATAGRGAVHETRAAAGAAAPAAGLAAGLAT